MENVPQLQVPKYLAPNITLTSHHAQIWTLCVCLRVTIQSICARNIPEAAKKVFPTQKKNKSIY